MKKFAFSGAFFKEDGANESENAAHKLLASLLRHNAGTNDKEAEEKEKINVATKNKNAILSELYPENPDKSRDPRPLNGDNSSSGENLPAQSPNNAFFVKNSKSDSGKIVKNGDFYKNTDQNNANYSKNYYFLQNCHNENCKTVENGYFSSDKQDKNGKDGYLLQKNGRNVGPSGANTGKVTPDNAEKVKKSGEDDYFSPPPYYKLP